MTISIPTPADLEKDGFRALVSPEATGSDLVAQLQADTTYMLINAQTGERIHGARLRARGDDLYSFLGLGVYKENFGSTGTWICLAGNGTEAGMAVPPNEWWYKAE